MFIYSAVMQVLKRLTRTCHACGHRQIVPTRLNDASVPCAVCKRPIPPPR